MKSTSNHGRRMKITIISTLVLGAFLGASETAQAQADLISGLGLQDVTPVNLTGFGNLAQLPGFEDGSTGIDGPTFGYGVSYGVYDVSFTAFIAPISISLITSPSVVIPEPSSLGMSALGGLGAFLLTIRSRKA